MFNFVPQSLFKSIITMKYLISLSILVFGIFSVAAQKNASNTKATYSDGIMIEPIHFNASVPLVKQHLSSSSSQNMIFLDVRSEEEAQHGKIENAIVIDFKSPDFDNKIAQLDKTKKYVVYCYNGSISEKASKKLKDSGFLQVLNLKDGFKSWEASK